MSAIQTIIETYIRFADEQGLLALRAHRLKLLATIDENDPFARNLLGQCVEEISAIDAGLVRLRPPVVPLQSVSAPETISSDMDVLSLEGPETEPTVSEEIVNEEIVSPEVVSQEVVSQDDDAVAPQASDISAPEMISSDTDVPSLEGLETEPIGGQVVSREILSQEDDAVASQASDISAPETIWSHTDAPSLEGLETEPIASQEIASQETASQETASQEVVGQEIVSQDDDAVAPQANDISVSDQDAGAAPPPPAPDLQKLAPAAAGPTDPSLIAGSLLAASLAAKQPDGTRPAMEMLKLQRRLRTRLKG